MTSRTLAHSLAVCFVFAAAALGCTTPLPLATDTGTRLDAAAPDEDSGSALDADLSADTGSEADARGATDSGATDSGATDSGATDSGTIARRDTGPGTDSGASSDAGSTGSCGNGARDTGEACDDGNTVTETACPYGTATCTGCNATCTAVLSLTGPTCGDGIVNGPEACEIGAIDCVPCGALTCPSSESREQSLSCSSTCTWMNVGTCGCMRCVI